MNYSDFFNKLLLEAIDNPLGTGSRYDIPKGVGAEGLADEDTDPSQLESDLAVNGQPAVTPDEARDYYYKNIKIDFSTPDSRKETIKNVEKFITDVTNAQKQYKNKSPSEQRTMLPTIADLTMRGDLFDSFQKISSKIKALKELEDLELEAQRKRQEIMDEDGDELQSLPDPNSTPQV